MAKIRKPKTPRRKQPKPKWQWHRTGLYQGGKARNEWIAWREYKGDHIDFDIQRRWEPDQRKYSYDLGFSINHSGDILEHDLKNVREAKKVAESYLNDPDSLYYRVRGRVKGDD